MWGILLLLPSFGARTVRRVFAEHRARGIDDVSLDVNFELLGSRCVLCVVGVQAPGT